MAAESLSAADKEFLALCEEEFKDRHTEKDEEFMKVHNAEPLIPPIMETWWVSEYSRRRNDRRFNNRHSHPYERQNRDSHRRSGHNEYENDNRREGYRSYYNRPRFNN